MNKQGHDGREKLSERQSWMTFRKLYDMESMMMWHMWWGWKDTWLCPGAIIKSVLKPDIILEEELQVSQNFGNWLSMEKWVKATLREFPK